MNSTRRLENDLMAFKIQSIEEMVHLINFVMRNEKMNVRKEREFVYTYYVYKFGGFNFLQGKE